MIQLPAAHFNNTHFFNYELTMTTKTPTSNLCKFQLENISIYEFFAWFHVHGIVPGKRLNFPNINKRHWRDWMEDTKKIPLRAKYQWDNHTEHNNWKYYDRRDYFNFPIVNFPFICSNIPAAPAYRLYISQLIRYSRACGSYQGFVDRGFCQQGSYWTKGSSWLSWSLHFESFTVATITWLAVMEYLCHKWPRICSTCRNHFLVLSPFMTYHRVCN
jgi:hypothetical protein